MNHSPNLSVEPIVQTLNELLESHKELIVFSKLKKKALVAGEVGELTKLLNQESKWVKTIERLEIQRSELTRQYFDDKGFRMVRMVNVSELSRLVFDGNQKQQLLDVHKQLLEILEELKATNSLNLQLTEQALQFNRFSYDLFFGSSDDAVVYQPPGHQQNGPLARSIFDSKA